MKRYALIKGDLVVNVVMSETLPQPNELFDYAVEIQLGENVSPRMIYSGGVYSRQTRQRFRLRVYEFRERFTFDEKETIEIEQQDNPADSNMLRKRKARLRAVEKDILSRPFVDLRDPIVIAFVQFLETVGQLAAGRAAQILTPETIET